MAEQIIFEPQSGEEPPVILSPQALLDTMGFTTELAARNAYYKAQLAALGEQAIDINPKKEGAA